MLKAGTSLAIAFALLVESTSCDLTTSESPSIVPRADFATVAPPTNDTSYSWRAAVASSRSGVASNDVWSVAYSKARTTVANMTLEEKINVTIGISQSFTGCNGVSGGVPRLGFPGFCLQDGPAGVRAADFVSGFPAQMHLGSSWNRGLVLDVAKYMGAEFKAKGVNVALGPVVGPLGRIAKGGRNWEGYTNDPYLAGQLVYNSVQGIQQSVIACVKHLVGNEQETLRTPFPIDPTSSAISSNIDDKTMHELYMWPFADAVRAGAASVMCSYQKLNQTYACQNDAVQNVLLKKELNFPGIVISDWNAQHTGYQSALAGLDMAMPDSIEFWKSGLAPAVRNGSVPQARMDDMVVRILAAWHSLNQNSASYPPLGYGIPTDLTKPHKRVDARNPASRATILQAAIEGHVLVKNVNAALPLRTPKMLSLFGYDAHAPTQMYPASGNIGRWALGYSSINSTDEDLIGFFAGLASDYPDIAAGGTIIAGGGSGTSTPSYLSAPYDAIADQARKDGTSLLWDFSSFDPLVEADSDACIVMLNTWSAEGYDRPNLADKASDDLVKNVAGKCSNTIVVIHNAGIRIVDAWINNPNVKAVIFAHLPGQESGAALVDILYGRQSPSGRLPYTVAKKESDYGGLLDPSQAGSSGFEFLYPQSNFSEGIKIDYKSFIARNITPRFPFGFGLGYSTFTYNALRVALGNSRNLGPEVTVNLEPTASASPGLGGNSALYEPVAFVTCDITNTGSVPAAEVAQLYVGIPGSVPKQLRGFDKKVIQPGATERFTFDLTRRDLSLWDVRAQDWVLQRGAYRVYVGRNVLDTPLDATLSI